MFFTSRPVQRLLQAVGLVCSVAVIVACGGGGSPEPLAPAVAAADRATAYAAGPITGFGSIIVNGVRYDDSAASITDDDGVSHRPERLKLGMVVEVDAQGVDRVAAQGKALKVRFGAQLVGPAAGPLAADSSLTVLGQKVLVNATTVVDDALVGGLAALTAATVSEVHRLVDTATCRLPATAIEAHSVALRSRHNGCVGWPVVDGIGGRALERAEPGGKGRRVGKGVQRQPGKARQGVGHNFARVGLNGQIRIAV